jgi:UDP-N-acetylmuramyl pentapeptide phosphotransferase/UDP-N-acetylglucosamine-1-phosphate transferase
MLKFNEIILNNGLILYFLILFLLELVYLKIADYYNIVDKPNERSSHTMPIIRGGGFIFVLGFLLWSAANQFAYPYLLMGVLLAAIISFIDDVKALPSILRFGVHIVSVALFLFQLGLLQFSWWLIPLFILLIGIKNAYNFMDGINGITGFYSLAIFVPFWITEQDELLKGFVGVTMVSLVVFLFFNARKRAKCFAGDIGSISIALIVMFAIVHRIIETGNYIYILALLVYGIDSIFTIAQRLFQGENIFKAHRKHLYQYLVNEFKMPHLLVSGIYAFLQLLFNFWLLMVEPSINIALGFSLLFGVSYVLLKFVLNKRRGHFNYN